MQNRNGVVALPVHNLAILAILSLYLFPTLFFWTFVKSD